MTTLFLQYVVYIVHVMLSTIVEFISCNNIFSPENGLMKSNKDLAISLCSNDKRKSCDKCNATVTFRSIKTND